MSGGSQNVNGGTGTVSKMNDGHQYISGGGTGTVSVNNGGWQNIYSDGTGMVSTMEYGFQDIDNGGTGTVSTMNDGYQNISSCGAGTINTMNGGNQYIAGSGIIDVMSNGTQWISSGGAGTVSTMNGGNQNISGGGTGIISIMERGEQHISAGGKGIISAMDLYYGKQYISSGGTGTVGTMNNGGSQVIYSGGTGTINYVSTNQLGKQIISGGTGVISAMDYGEQHISVGGAGMINVMNDGSQVIDGGTGTIGVVNGGTQNVYNGGTGIIDTVNGNLTEMFILTGAVATVNIMNAGMQEIYGGTVTVGTMSDGYQKINAGGTGTVSTMFGGTQSIYSGGTGTISTMSGGTQSIYGGTALDTVIAGGTQLVRSGAVVSGATLSAGVQQVYDGTNLNNIIFAGGTQAVMSGAAVSGMQVAAGQQRVENGGTAINTEIGADGSLQLSRGGTVKDMTLTSGSLKLENINGGSFTVSGTLTANNATVDMTDSSIKRVVPTVAYETLTIDKLSGSGTTFIMDTDLAGATNSDKITITDADAATHYVQIKDLSKLNGVEVIGAHQQLLITDTSGKLTFEGKEFNAGGLWDVDPTLAKGDSLGLSANDWYLTKIAKTANNDTQVLLDAADNSYALWRNTNDSLRSRLGALASGSEQSDGIWARTQAGRFSGDNYEGRYNLYQLGFDQAADAKSVYGAAVDYGDGTGSYDNGSGKDKLKSFSLYGVWTGDNGAYTNVTARYGMVSTDLESYGDYPDKAEYKQHAYSVSVEYGKRFELEKGFFIEPNAQFTLGRLGSIDYTTDRGANGYIEGMNSAIGRIGFVMGQKITGDSDIYLKADLLHEFAGERDLQLTSDAGGTNDILRKHNDYGDTWFELGLGANIKVSKAASIYGEIERGFGGDINKKWSVNGGVRFTF